MKKIVHETVIIILSLMLTACGEGNSSDSNSTNESSIEPSSANQETTTEVEETIVETSAIQTPTVIGLFTVVAGEDVTTRVNESITLMGTVINANTKNIVYEWKKGSTILATTASFDYTPQKEVALPTAGHRVDVLVFTVSTKSSDSVSDMLNITVLP